MKLHIFTVHLNPKWMEIQKRFVSRHLSKAQIVWHPIVDSRYPKLHRISDKIFGNSVITGVRDCDHAWLSMRHAVKLSLAYDSLSPNMGDDDLVLVLDSDAFPIRDASALLEKVANDETTVVAVQRKENGDSYAHPAFCLTKKRNLDWLSQYLPEDVDSPWLPHSVYSILNPVKRDTAGALYQCLLKSRAKWTPLNRTNVIDYFPVLFGIYGNIVYHHGCGSRRPLVDIHRIGVKFSRRQLMNMADSYGAVGEAIYQRIKVDDEFYKLFTGEEHVGPISPRYESRMMRLTLGAYDHLDEKFTKILKKSFEKVPRSF